MSRSKGRASSLVIAGRLLLLLLAAAAAVSAFGLSRADDRAASSAQERYACPMHPEVTSSAPDACLICRMALQRVGASTPGDASSAATTSDADQAASLAPSEVPRDYNRIGTASRRVFAREVRAPAWLEAGGLVTAVLYRDELTGLAAGEHGVFVRSVAPAVGIDVRLTTEPPSPWDGSTSQVHFRLDPGAPPLGSGEIGWVTLAAKARELLVVPSSAVLQSSRGPYVLAVSPDGHTFTKRMLVIGKASSGLTVVLAGLHDHERVVVGNAFFLDAARRSSAREGMDLVGQ